MSTTLSEILKVGFTGMGAAHEAISACSNGQQPPTKLNCLYAVLGFLIGAGYDPTLFQPLTVFPKGPLMDQSRRTGTLAGRET